MFLDQKRVLNEVSFKNALMDTDLKRVLTKRALFKDLMGLVLWSSEIDQMTSDIQQSEGI